MKNREIYPGLCHFSKYTFLLPGSGRHCCDRMELQLPVQSVPITTTRNSCELEPCSWRGVLDTTLCDKLTATATEILLKVTLNTINHITGYHIRRKIIKFCFS